MVVRWGSHEHGAPDVVGDHGFPRMGTDAR